MILDSCAMLGLLNNSGGNCYKSLFKAEKNPLFTQFYFYLQGSYKYSLCKHIQIKCLIPSCSPSWFLSSVNGIVIRRAILASLTIRSNHKILLIQILEYLSNISIFVHLNCHRLAPVNINYFIHSLLQELVISLLSLMLFVKIMPSSKKMNSFCYILTWYPYFSIQNFSNYIFLHL